MRKAVIFETERLVFRKFEFDDAEFVMELVNDPDWLRNIGDKKVHSIADAERYLREGPMTLYEKHVVGLWAVEHRERNKLIGMCGLVKRDWLGDFDLGFALLPAYRGQGFAFEAAQGVLNYVTRVKKLPRLAAIVNPSNAPSVKLLQKLGFQRTGQITLPGETKSIDLYHANI